jgi:hypothetical protein
MTIAAVRVSHLPSLAFQHRRDLPTAPVVYFVIGENLDVVYVGQTANLHDRWRSHHRALQMQSGDYRIHWMEVFDEQRRIEIEREAINYFRPVWNRSEVPIADMKRVEAYINDVARYMEINPRDLVCKILTEWAYNRSGDFLRK